MKGWFILLGVVGLVAAGLPTRAAPKHPDAAALLTTKDALALVGGPLGEASKFESKPDAENGHDHNTMCGYFSKGYRSAKRPPERGVRLSLHRFKTPKEAREFYDLKREMDQIAGSPSAGAKVEVLKGVGEAGVLSLKMLTPEPKAVYQGIATFLKGSVVAELAVVKRDVPVAATVAAGAKQVAARLL